MRHSRARSGGDGGVGRKSELAISELFHTLPTVPQRWRGECGVSADSAVGEQGSAPAQRYGKEPDLQEM